MGLDIYVFKEPIEPVDAKPIQIGCFRKVNCLINWVEENIGPFENCVDIPMPKDKVILLKDTLNKVTQENSDEVLPTKLGHFFGNVAYNEIYWEDIKELKEWVEEILNNFNFEENRLFLYPAW